MQGKISIIVPVYKVEEELERCVQSLVNQTYKNIEIILVDDGSPDRCPLLCDEYAQKDSRVRVIHKKNGGLSDARNVGLQATTGEYVLYIDSDDYIDLDSCERFLKATEQQKVDIVVGSAIMEKSDGSCEEMLHTEPLQELYIMQVNLLKNPSERINGMHLLVLICIGETSYYKMNFFLRLASTLKICKCYHEFF